MADHQAWASYDTTELDHCETVLADAMAAGTCDIDLRHEDLLAELDAELALRHRVTADGASVAGAPG